MQHLGNRRQETMEELFGEIFLSGQLTRRDRLRLREALLADTIAEDHQDIINRVIHSTKRGRLQLKT
jgi:hypothetical protein